MDTDQTAEVEIESGYEDVPDISELDSFDTRTPAEVEASKQEESPAEIESDTKEGTKVEEPETTKVEEKLYQPPQKVQLQAKPFEAQIPVDEYGNIDPAGLGEYLQARDEHLKEVARVEAQNANYEMIHGQREWSDVTEAYPELVKNETTRGLIENLRVADAIRGGEGSLMAAAKLFSDQLGAARNEGVASTQSNITRQKSVALSSSTKSQPTDKSNISSLRKRAFSAGNSDNARLEYISALYESGALDK